MKEEKRSCKGCGSDFVIDGTDIDFYKKLDAPHPLYCPSCRMQRRLMHRNERTLYKRSCDLCQEGTVSIYPDDVPFPVYCQKCWWSDRWDASQFGMDYDPGRPFFEQFDELQRKVPRIALLVINSVNSEYTNNTEDLKNCYLFFASGECEDCMYGRLVYRCKSVMDVSFVYDSELCYECVDVRNCFNVMFSERCQTSSDLLFCFDTRDSQNCILTIGGRHQKYCIEGKNVSKDEYKAKKREILSSPESLEKARKRFEQLKSTALVKYAFTTKCNDATGDYLHNCHEVRNAYDTTNAKACRHIADTEDPIDSWDINNAYYKPELCLDSMGLLQTFRCKYDRYTLYCTEVEYCDNCYNLESGLGCVGVKKGKYQILNKTYTKDEYARLKKEIIDSLTKAGLYGQFFDPSLSLFGYNETLSQDYYPLTKEEALKKGFRWQDSIPGTFGKETISLKDIPGAIGDVDDSITKETLACGECGKNFRITPQELAFYRRLGIPLPRRDFECRHRARVSARTPRRLWKRQCMCDYEIRENSAVHEHHRTGRCPNEFETGYAPERKEVVYCESCYQQELS